MELNTVREIIEADDQAIEAVICIDHLRFFQREQLRTDPERGQRIMEQLMYESDTQCLHVLRMRQRVFFKLLDTLKKYGLKDSHRVRSEVALGMSLKILGHNSSQRSIAADFQVAQWTVTTKFDDVVNALCCLHSDIVSWKREELVDIPPRIMHDRRYFPYFQDCIGAIDGTHVRVRVGGDKKITYWNHHNYTSMNILAVCDFNMRFIYTRIGVPGRAHDSKILTYCARHDNFFPFPSSEKYFLVDSGYPNRRGFLAPYRGEAYHPNHFAGRRPGTVRETFNKRHSSLRSVIERTFGVWKGKWSILEGRVRYDVQMQEKIVAATMALHNFIRDSNIEDDDFNAAEETENYDADREGNMSPSHDDNVVDRNYDPTADQYMSTVRDDIAREIWDAR
ncbi:PREDICTED: uncharacterized protein LOC104704161 [Camelina sativa]|nr:PREDICTED: uncharacterized protein LOC104704161 [Camelina sativa]